MEYKPEYMNIPDGEFQRRIETLYTMMEACTLCPHRCGVNRFEEQSGKCGMGAQAVISSAFAHFGEEPPLTGRCGSGTVFFTGCNLKCVFCQNYDISHQMQGHAVSEEQLAQIMLALQKNGCHNINFVTPTHFVPQMVMAIFSAKLNGLAIPIVYNCGGYESTEILRLLDGIIDIYMPDLKFTSSEMAEKYTNSSDYSGRAFDALTEMHRQAGILKVEEGIARKGLLIRHLVMPGHPGNAEQALTFISQKLSKDSYVNIMGQYGPCFHASKFEEINRTPTFAEMNFANKTARSLGLHRGF